MIVYSEQYWRDIEKIVPYIINKELLFEKTLLVTGAGGLICSTVAAVVFYLNRHCDAKITLLLAGRNGEKLCTRFSPFIDGSDWHFIQYDAAKPFSCERHIDFIIHGAGYGDPKGITEQPVETMLANFNGTYTLLDSLRVQNEGILLFISSSEVYGKKTAEAAYKENDYGFVDLLLPRSSYPSAKRAAETLCAAFFAEYGVQSVIARPGHVYGAQMTDADSRVCADCLRRAARGIPVVLHSEGRQLRSWCNSLDCASALLAILLNGETSRAYNISNKHAIASIRTFAERVARAAGVPFECAEPAPAEKAAWNAMDNSSLDAGRLEALGWRGVFDLDDGIAETLSAYRTAEPSR